MGTITLDSITVPERPSPPRIVIHGEHGVGKTTFVAGAASPIFLRTEDGLGTLKVPTFPLLRHYADVMEALRVLYHGQHKYRTAVVDSIDWLEPMIWEAVAFEGGKQHIEEFGYGKGYKMADDKWKQFLNALTSLRDKRGMTIVCIAHTRIQRYDAPDSPPYDRFCLKLQERAAALVDEWADIIGFARFEVRTEQTDVGFDKKVTRGVSSGERQLALEKRPAYDAKNRYGLPPVIGLYWPQFRDVLTQAFGGAPAPAVSTSAEAATSAADPTTQENGAAATTPVAEEEPAHV